jgi:hypothetical protein
VSPVGGGAGSKAYSLGSTSRIEVCDESVCEVGAATWKCALNQASTPYSG